MNQHHGPMAHSHRQIKFTEREKVSPGRNSGESFRPEKTAQLQSHGRLGKCWDVKFRGLFLSLRSQTRVLGAQRGWGDTQRWLPKAKWANGQLASRNKEACLSFSKPNYCAG